MSGEEEVDAKTMFEIYRESGYNSDFQCIFYTELEEHSRGKEIAKAAAGTPVFAGFFADSCNEKAHEAVTALLDELNELDEDAPVPPSRIFIEKLSEFMVPPYTDPEMKNLSDAN